MKFEFIHGDMMLYMTAENERDLKLFRKLTKRSINILGSNIDTKQSKKWFAITFPQKYNYVAEDDYL